MKSVLSIIFVTLLTGAMASAAVAEEMNLGQVVAKCKTEAASEEVTSDKMSSFMRQCLEEYGIESADIDSAVQDSLPEGSEAQPSKDEG